MSEKEYQYWEGDYIKKLQPNEVFVFGSNPEGRHGLGAAKLAKAFGAVYGKGRGLYGQSYALVTKNLSKGFHEKSTGITYHTAGVRSVSLEQISLNIDEMYECARNHSDKYFLVAYKNDSRNLNGYSCRDLWDVFTKNKDVPPNIKFHESFKYFVLADEQDRKYQEEKQMKNQQQEQKFTFFWLTHTPFSQWHPSIFTVKNINFSSAEQFMMYCKAKLFKDENIAQQIMDMNKFGVLKDFLDGNISRKDILKDQELLKKWNDCQKTIKNLGRKVSGFNQEVWNKHNANFVTRGSYEKFTQDLELEPILLNTEGTQLVEASPFDTIYGIGMKASDPRAKNPSQWLGQNVLGKALDKARDRRIYEIKLSKEEEQQQIPVKKLKI